MTDRKKSSLDRNYRISASLLVGGSFLLTVLYCVLVSESKHRFSAIGAAFLIAGAPFVAGGFLGFLFGLPKTLQNESVASTNGSKRHAWQPNTNLELASDWLTKILLGIGLTQLTKLPEQVQNTGEYMAAVIGKDASSAAGSMILVVFLVAGFVVAYLLTKFDLGTAIDQQDGLLDALANAAAKAPTDRRAAEGLVLTSLYTPAPDGYETAIKAGETYLNRVGYQASDDDADLFGYLAAAYGQKFQYKRDHDKAKDDDLAATKAKVLENAAQAVRRDPEWRGLLRQMANPSVNGSDDDLVALKDDKELQALLAEPSPPQ